MHASEITDMKCWRAGKRGVDLVCWVCGSSWATTWTSVARVHKARCCGLQQACRVGALTQAESLRLYVLAAETVHFSARAELLVSKLGRSSKLRPRFLIIVSYLFSVTR